MATQFVNFTKHERSLWLWWIEHSQTTAPEQKDDASRVAAEFGLTADAKAAYAHWSGKGQFAYKASVQTVHPADDANFSSGQKAMKQVVDYFGPSCYVHCSQPALDVYFSDDPEFRIHQPKAGKRDVGDSAIFICHHYLHDILTYCFLRHERNPSGLVRLFATPQLRSSCRGFQVQVRLEWTTGDVVGNEAWLF